MARVATVRLIAAVDMRRITPCCDTVFHSESSLTAAQTSRQMQYWAMCPKLERSEWRYPLLQERYAPKEFVKLSTVVQFAL